MLHNALIIAGSFKTADRRVVELAALLHDIARPEEFRSGGKVCHAEKGAEKAVRILRKCGLRDERLIDAVSECVGRHRYRGRLKPETLEQRILFDADKLDCIGAVGVGRAFHFAGRLGAKLHNTEEAALKSSAYSREDTAFREYLVKLRNVHRRMTTAPGRRLARRRYIIMKNFFDELNGEVFGRK